MLISKFSNSLVELTGHAQIKCEHPWAFALGSRHLRFYLPLDCKIILTCDSIWPGGSADQTLFQDSLNQIIWNLEIKNGVLLPKVPTTFWTPDALYENKYLQLSNLATGNLLINVIEADVTIYKAYFNTEGQLFGANETSTLTNITTGLAQSLDPTEDPFITVSLIAGILELFERNPTELIASTFARIPNSPKALSFGKDLLENLILSKLLLSALYSWKLTLPSQQLAIPKLEERLLQYLKVVAKHASASLDPKNGLLFSKIEGELYGNPSYIATACALVLWSELFNNYDNDYTYLQSIYYCYRLWPDLKHEPNVESIDRYNLAQAIINEYTKTSDNFKFLTLDAVVAPLNIYTLSVGLSKTLPANLYGAPLDFKIDLPQASELYSLPKTIATINAFASKTKETLIQAMPEGYLWATHESLKSSSVFGSVFSAISQTIALAYKHYESRVGNYASPGAKPGLNSIWAEAIEPKPKAVPSYFWQVWIHDYANRPGVGISKLNWSAYLSGLAQIPVALVDYQFFKLPPSKIVSNSPELTSLSLIKPFGLDENIQDPHVNDLEEIGVLQNKVKQEQVISFSALNYASDSQTAGIETRPLAIADRTNQIEFCGYGRPLPVIKALKESCIVGVVPSVKHYTTTNVAKPRKGLKRSLVNISWTDMCGYDPSTLPIINLSLTFSNTDAGGGGGYGGP